MYNSSLNVFFAVNISPDTPLKVVKEGEDGWTRVVDYPSVPFPKGSLFDGLDDNSTRARLDGIPLPKYREISSPSRALKGREANIRRSERISERGPYDFD